MRGTVVMFALGVSLLGSAVSAGRGDQDLAWFDSVKLRLQPGPAIRPGYEVTVLSDGQVTYEGDSHSKTQGRRVGIVGTAKMQILRAAVNSAELHSLAGKYKRSMETCRDGISDSNTIVITVTARGTIETLSFYEGYGCDLALRNRIESIAHTIVEISGARDWAGVNAL